jgi:hypothetical protein
MKPDIMNELLVLVMAVCMYAQPAAEPSVLALV